MEKHQKFTKAERAAWPLDHKRCRECWVVLPLSSFHNHSSGLMGKYHTCKECRSAQMKGEWGKRPFENTMLYSSRHRAKKYGIPHTIQLRDIVIPKKCPVLGVDIVLERNHTYRPSLDQIQPRAGYTPDNIIVLSHRANVLKHNMSKEEATMLAEWMNKNCNWTDVRLS